MSNLRGLKSIFVSFQELDQLSPYQTKLWIPARFVVSPCNCISIKIQLTKSIWNKPSPHQRPNMDAFSNAGKKDELLVLLLSGWNALSSFKACLKSIPVAYKHSFNHPFPPEENMPKVIKYTAFFFLSFNLDDHWKCIQQNQQHIKKPRHALPAQECVCTTAPPNPAHDYSCWFLQLQKLLTGWRCIWEFWENCPMCNRDCSNLWEFCAGV